MDQGFCCAEGLCCAEEEVIANLEEDFSNSYPPVGIAERCTTKQPDIGTVSFPKLLLWWTHATNKDFFLEESLWNTYTSLYLSTLLMHYTKHLYYYCNYALFDFCCSVYVDIFYIEVSVHFTRALGLPIVYLLTFLISFVFSVNRSSETREKWIQLILIWCATSEPHDCIKHC